jgi:hypothetical protein
MKKAILLAAAFLPVAAYLPRPALAADAPSDKPAAPATQPAATDVPSLIHQLGDDDFHARQEAGRKLREMGKTALPALKDAQNSPDPEVRARAQELAQQIERPQQLGPIPQPVPGNNWTQSISSSNFNGAKTIDVRENGRTIHIEEDAAGLRIKVTGQIEGKPVTRDYKADNAEQLKRENAEAFALYQQFAQGGFNGIQGGGIVIQGRAGFIGGLRPNLIPPPPMPVPARRPGPAGDDLNRLEDKILEEMKGAKLPDDQQDQVKGLLKDLREVLPTADANGDGVSAQMREYNRRSDALRKELKDLKLPDPGDALPPPASGRLGIAAQEEVVEGQGLVVTHILPDGRAEKVGLKEQDVIQKVNGKDVHSTHDLRKLVTENPKGLVIEGLRAGKPLKLEEKDK